MYAFNLVICKFSLGYMAEMSEIKSSIYLSLYMLMLSQDKLLKSVHGTNYN